VLSSRVGEMNLRKKKKELVIRGKKPRRGKEKSTYIPYPRQAGLAESGGEKGRCFIGEAARTQQPERGEKHHASTIRETDVPLGEKEGACVL